MKYPILCMSLLITSVTTSCYRADEALVGTSGSLQKKNALEGASASGQTPTSLEAGAKKKIATATYFLDIETASGAKPCAGELNLDIMEDFTIGMKDSKAVCGSLTLDLEKLLGAQLQGSAGVTLSALSSDGQILGLAEIAGAKFAPPRPFIVGPIVQDLSKFVGLKRTTATTVTVAKPDSGPPLSAAGSFVTTVLGVDQAYSNKFLKKGFDKVMHWTLETQGFTGVPAKYGLLFKKWEWYWNIRPIMVPKIIITLDGLNGFIDSKSVDSLAELVGEITVTLTVKDYNISGS